MVINIKGPGFGIGLIAWKLQEGLLVYFSPFFLAILVHRAYGPKKSVNFSLKI